MNHVTVVAGNGLSLTRIAAGRVVAGDTIIRTNNFFFEDRYFLGKTVDLAFVGGDPRVAPFVFETLNRARSHYDVRQWSASSDRVARIGQRFLQTPYRPMQPADQATTAKLAELQARYQVVPSTGIQALLMARAMGARRIVLAGIDLYAGPQRYAYAPGRHQRDLLGGDLATRAYDRHLHHPDLDREMIGWLANRPGMTLWRSADCPALDGLLDLAPERPGTPVLAAPKLQPQMLDWADWAGWYPIALLKLLRRVRRWQRRLSGDLS
jgi:hypothetical protein